jgi:RNA polymerase sigma-70 factor (ECF subfamily)
MIEVAPPPLGIDDARLLRRAATGDWDSIGEFYGRHRDGALAVAISVLADPIDAEDVVHEVFLDLPRMARTYDPRRGRPEQWLCRSVRNRAIDHVRRRSRRQSRVAPTTDGPESLLALVPSKAASPVDEVEAAEFLDLLGRLDPRYAHLVRLAFVDGWSHSAIAQITGIPLGTVKTRLRNSMRQIREMLADPHRTASSRTAAREASSGTVIVVSADAAFRNAAARSVAGLASSSVLTPRAWSSSALVSPTPAAVVLDLPTDREKAADLIGVLAVHGWDDIPVLVRRRGRLPANVPSRRGMTLVLGGEDTPDLDVQTAVPALLTVGENAAQRAKAMVHLLRSDGAFLAGDRLGRVFSVTRAAAAVLGWAPRQLSGMYVTDLSATSVTDAERWWQELVTAGHWTGRTVLRRPSGPPIEVTGYAWMVPSGGFLATIALRRASENAA